MTGSLQSTIEAAGGALAMMRHAQTGPYVFPIPGEFSNWREEQRAWREGVALMDQSFHMTDLYVEGPDVIPFVSSLAVTSVKGFGDNGDPVGISTYSAFLAPDAAWVNLAVVDEAHAAIGTRLTILWAEPHGGSARPTVEPHVQMPMRGTVAGWPFSKVARTGYRPG